jgi:TolA-binding protein
MPIRPSSFALLSFSVLAICASGVCADTVTIGTLSYEGTVNGLRKGKLSLTLKNGDERLFDLPEVTSVGLDKWPKLLEAERLRVDPLQALPAAEAYKDLIPTLNKPELKTLVQWRAIDPTDRAQRWTDAVVLFLDVYQAASSDAIWKARPTHMPQPASRLLPESADKIATALKLRAEARSPEARSPAADDVQKNLRLMLMEVYNRSGDTQAAARLAREISTGIAEDPHPRTPAATAPTAALSAIESALNAGNFDEAQQQADALLATAEGETAAQIYALKARAYEGQQQLESAAANWLRIVAHYPTSLAAPGALFHAAQLEQRLQHPQSAQALLEELKAKYPDSPEAKNLKDR